MRYSDRAKTKMFVYGCLNLLNFGGKTFFRVGKKKFHPKNLNETKTCELALSAVIRSLE